MTNITSLYRVILILASCLPVFRLTAQDINPIVRSWELGPLTWNDFQVKQVSDNSLYYSNLTADLYGGYERKRDGNLVYDVYTVRNEMYPLSSWYDPDKCTDWTLRYEQTRFDIMEVFRRLDQNQYYHNPLMKEKWYYYSNAVYETIRTFDQESKYGTDTLVVEEYERTYRKKLDSIAIKPLPSPIVRTKKWGLGFILGTDMEYFLTQVPDNLSFTCGFGLGMDISYNRWFLEMYMSVDNAGELESDNFYFDPEFDYSWKKGRKVTSLKINFNLGYKMLDNTRWTIMPVIGIGGCDFRQDTDTPIDGNYSGYKLSSISGTRIQAGIMLDWKHRRYISRVTNSYLESKIRLQIAGARTGFDVIGDSYSINFNLLYAFDMRDLLGLAY